MSESPYNPYRDPAASVLGGLPSGCLGSTGAMPLRQALRLIGMARPYQAHTAEEVELARKVCKVALVHARLTGNEPREKALSQAREVIKKRASHFCAEILPRGNVCGSAKHAGSARCRACNNRRRYGATRKD